MEYKRYYTRLKVGTVATDKYVQGVIMGIMRCICTFGDSEYEDVKFDDSSSCILKDRKTGDMIYCALTTRERYYEFRDMIEALYPETCDFDVFD